MDIVFDIAVSHASTIGGHAHAQCVAITGADVVTLKDKVIKKLLLPVILMQHGIVSFNLKELHNNNTNFFSFVGDWHEQTQTINQHVHAFCAVLTLSHSCSDGTGCSYSFLFILKWH